MSRGGCHCVLPDGCDCGPARGKNQCAHGSLARSCPRCEDAATIARLTAALTEIAERFEGSAHLEWAGAGTCDCVVHVARRALGFSAG